MRVRDIMTPHVEVVSPEDTLREAAELMRAVDAGALPVVSGDSLVGMVTDRDIVVRGLALGCTADSPVTEVMSSEVHSIGDEAPLEAAAEVMRLAQVRRLPVVDASGLLVGVVSLGDLAEVLPPHVTGGLLVVLSEPAPSFAH
jgi:CBS domain-containing protein